MKFVRAEADLATDPVFSSDVLKDGKEEESREAENRYKPKAST